jgi:hypothetical protein
VSHAVLNVFSERTVFVRLPDKAGGPQRTAWQRAFQGLKQAEEEGYPPYGAPHLWASGAGSDRVAFATPGDAWDTLRFFFPVDPGSAYSKLIGKPGLFAWVTVDLSKGYFMGCSFRHRP